MGGGITAVVQGFDNNLSASDDHAVARLMAGYIGKGSVLRIHIGQTLAGVSFLICRWGLWDKEDLQLGRGDEAAVFVQDLAGHRDHRKWFAAAAACQQAESGKDEEHRNFF